MYTNSAANNDEKRVNALMAMVPPENENSSISMMIGFPSNNVVSETRLATKYRINSV